MIDQDAVDEPIFSVFLDRTSGGSDSKLILGGFDEDLFKSDTLHYHSVVSEYYWMLALDRIWLDDVDTGICNEDEPCFAVLDTGTTLLTGPKDMLTNLMEMIDTDDTCSNYLEMPHIKSYIYLFYLFYYKFINL